MKVIFIGAGPGNPDLLTLRAAKLLKKCRCCIYAGSLVSPEVLGLLPRSAYKHDSARLSLEQIVEIYRQAKKERRDVLRLHSGDPSIYGAIREQMDELDKLNIPYEVIPGVSSFQASAAALKTELTAPELSQTIILTRLSGRTPVPEEQSLDRLAKTHSTLCLFLSVQKIGPLARTLARHYGEDCPMAVVYRASWPDEKIIRGTLKDIASKVARQGIQKTAMILVGRALDRNLPASKLYSGGFSHGYRKAPRHAVASKRRRVK